MNKKKPASQEEENELLFKYTDRTELICHVINDKESVINIIKLGGSFNAPQTAVKSILEFFEFSCYEGNLNKNTRRFYYFDYKEENSTKVPRYYIGKFPEMKQHLGNYPVFHLIFKKYEEGNDDSIIENFSTALYDCFSRHKYLKNSGVLGASDIKRISDYLDPTQKTQWTEVQISLAIKAFVKLISLHFNKKIIIIIEDMETLLIDYEKTQVTGNNIPKVENLIDTVLKGALENTQYIFKAFIISQKDSFNKRVIRLFSDAIVFDSLYYDNMSLFGITQKEKEQLCTKFSVPDDICELLDESYDDYMYGRNKIFNPDIFLQIIKKYKQEEKKSPKEATSLSPFLKKLLDKKINRIINKLLSIYEIRKKNFQICIGDEVLLKERPEIPQNLNLEINKLVEKQKLTIEDKAKLIFFAFKFLKKNKYVEMLKTFLPFGQSFSTFTAYNDKLREKLLVCLEEYYTNNYNIRKEFIAILIPQIKDLLVALGKEKVFTYVEKINQTLRSFSARDTSKDAKVSLQKANAKKENLKLKESLEYILLMAISNLPHLFTPPEVTFMTLKDDMIKFYDSLNKKLVIIRIINGLWNESSEDSSDNTSIINTNSDSVTNIICEKYFAIFIEIKAGYGGDRTNISIHFQTHAF